MYVIFFRVGFDCRFSKFSDAFIFFFHHTEIEIKSLSRAILKRRIIFIVGSNPFYAEHQRSCGGGPRIVTLNLAVEKLPYYIFRTPQTLSELALDEKYNRIIRNSRTLKQSVI